MNDNTLKEIFLSELNNLDTNIGRYDTHSLIIKGWAITLWSGLAYFAIKESVHFLFAVQIFILLIFWSFDALYKYYQRRFAIRSEKINAFLKDYIIIADENNNLKFEKKKITENNDEKNTKRPNDNIKKKNMEIITLPLVIHREVSPILIGNNESKLKSLYRSLILRVVINVYLFLIAVSFLTAYYIVPNINAIGLWFLVDSLIIISFSVFNYIFGYDNAISGYIKKKIRKWFKIFFTVFRWGTFIIIGINLLFLAYNLSTANFNCTLY